MNRDPLYEALKAKDDDIDFDCYGPAVILPFMPNVMEVISTIELKVPHDIDGSSICSRPRNVVDYYDLSSSEVIDQARLVMMQIPSYHDLNLPEDKGRIDDHPFCDIRLELNGLESESKMQNVGIELSNGSTVTCDVKYVNNNESDVNMMNQHDNSSFLGEKREANPVDLDEMPNSKKKKITNEGAKKNVPQISDGNGNMKGSVDWDCLERWKVWNDGDRVFHLESEVLMKMVNRIESCRANEVELINVVGLCHDHFKYCIGSCGYDGKDDKWLFNGVLCCYIFLKVYNIMDGDSRIWASEGVLEKCITFLKLIFAKRFKSSELSASILLSDGVDEVKMRNGGEMVEKGMMDGIFSMMPLICDEFCVLVSKTVLPDDLLVGVTFLVFEVVFEDGFEMLFCPFLRLAQMIFKSYVDCRDGIFREMLVRMDSFRKKKKFPLHNGLKGKGIGFLTCFALTMLQGLNDIAEMGKSGVVGFRYYESSLIWSNEFVKILLNELMVSMREKSEYQTYFGNFVEDLLVVLFQPEWPIARLILMRLTKVLIYMFRSMEGGGGKGVVESNRIFLCTILGRIGSKLALLKSMKEDDLGGKISKSTKESDLEGRENIGNGSEFTMKKARKCEDWDNIRCMICGSKWLNRDMIGCDICDRWFHEECCKFPKESIARLNEDNNEDGKLKWYCDSCLMERCKECVKRVIGSDDRLVVEQESIKLLALNYLRNYSNLDPFMYNEARRYLLCEFYGGESQNGIHAISALNEYDFNGKLAASDESIKVTADSTLIQDAEQEMFAFFRSLLYGGSMSPARVPFIMSRYYLNGKLQDMLNSIILSMLTAVKGESSAKFRSQIIKSVGYILGSDSSLMNDRGVYEIISYALTDSSPLVRERGLLMIGYCFLTNSDFISRYLSMVIHCVCDESVGVRRRAFRVLSNICHLAPSNDGLVVRICCDLLLGTESEGNILRRPLLAFLKQLWIGDDVSSKILHEQAFNELRMEDGSINSFATLSLSSLGFQVEFAMPNAKSSAYQMIRTIGRYLDVRNRNGLVLTTHGVHGRIEEMIDFIMSNGDKNDRLSQIIETIISLSNEVSSKAMVDGEVYEGEREMRAEFCKYIYDIQCTCMVIVRAISNSRPRLLIPHLDLIRLHIVVDDDQFSNKQSIANNKSIFIIENCCHIISKIYGIMEFFGNRQINLLKMDLCRLIDGQGMPVIEAAIKCACEVTIVCKWNDLWIRQLFKVFERTLRANPKQHSVIIRSLYSMSQIVRYYRFDRVDGEISANYERIECVDNLRQFKYNEYIETVWGFCLAYWNHPSVNIRVLTLRSLSGLIANFPGILVRKQCECIISESLADVADERLKIEVAKILINYLESEEDRLHRYHRSKFDGGYGNDFGLSSAIISIYLEDIVKMASSSSGAVRAIILNLICRALKSSSAHPFMCIPALMTLQADLDVRISNAATDMIVQLEPSKILNRIANGIIAAFKFQIKVYNRIKILNTTSKPVQSLYSQLYLSLCKSGNFARNEFLSIMIKLFDYRSKMLIRDEKKTNNTTVDISHRPPLPPYDDPSFFKFLVLIIGHLPFSKKEEPLLVLTRINSTLSNWDFSLGNLKHIISDQSDTHPRYDDVIITYSAYCLLILKRFFTLFYKLSNEKYQFHSPTEFKSHSIISIQSTTLEKFLSENDPEFHEFLQPNKDLWLKDKTQIKLIYKQLKKLQKYN